MSDLKQDFWVSAEEYTQESTFVESTKNEFFSLPILNEATKEEDAQTGSEHNRRDFLKYLGFSIGAATIAAGCETPIRKAIPYVTKPDGIIPGVANYYASTYVKGNEVMPVVIKTREGRPIKIEGNTLSKFTQGGTSARSQASVLDLYDSGRYRNPAKSDGKGKFSKATWKDLDAAVQGGLNPGSNIRILSNTITSPSMMASINKFIETYPGAKHVVYDPFSSSAMLIANERSFSKRVIPGYDFSKAQLVVNFGADFLTTWISPVEYANGWTGNRKIKDFAKPTLNRLVQYESNMSYTGSNADDRILIKPSEQGLAIAKLYNAVAAMTGGSAVSINGTLSNPKAEKSFAVVAKELVDNRNSGNASIVLSDSNNVSEQILINKINDLLGNYGKSIDLTNYSLQRQGLDKDVVTLLQEMNAGSVNAIFILGDANPAFDLPEAAQFSAALSKIPLSVSLSSVPNETSALCKYSAPDNHFMESWGDEQPKRFNYYLRQPVISPLFDTRQAGLSLLKWANQSVSDFGEFVKSHWQQNLFAAQRQFTGFQSFWDNALHDGLLEIGDSTPGGGGVAIDVSGLATSVSKPGTGLEIKYYEPLGVGCGSFANNPWLQELPDPVTRAVWTSVLHIPVSWNGDDAFEYKLNNKDTGLNKDGLLVNVKVNKVQIDDVPVVRQFGQYKDTVAMPLGYGRKEGNASAKNVGNYAFNALSRDAEGNIQYWSSGAEIVPTGKEDKHYASVQHHHTLGVKGKDKSNAVINVDEKVVMSIGSGYQGGLTDRSILKSATLETLGSEIEKLKEFRANAQHLNQATLYPSRDDIYSQGHHWGISIDPTSCIGCGACQVACVSENNVPIVGKKEVHRHHEMTWLRIDRYYYGDVESPNVFYQPMMCQHCENAPCENVCPVNATNHSSEGLNQMAYNRCVGTRYCANNCPYKVRRFNWFDYTTADLWGRNEPSVMPDGESMFYEENLTRLVLNPDVTVRSRGVIEKCSMCVQRIQEGKLRAKAEGRPMKETDVKPACVSACPTGGIIFGDQNTKDGILNKEWADPTTYFALEETNVRSKVGYKIKVTNKNKELA